MSVVSNIVGGLRFVGAMGSEFVTVESRISRLRLHLGRERFSKSEERDFDVAQLLKTANQDYQSKIVVAR